MGWEVGLKIFQNFDVVYERTLINYFPSKDDIIKMKIKSMRLTYKETELAKKVQTVIKNSHLMQNCLRYNTTSRFNYQS